MSDPVELPPQLCPRTVELTYVTGDTALVVPCELPTGHPHRGQPVHTASVYGVIADRSVPVLVKWVDQRDPAPRTSL
jgi:hypothetical protein